MAESAFRGDWLLKKFREFYVELHRQRRLAESGGGQAQTPPPAPHETAADGWGSFERAQAGASGNQTHDALVWLLRRQEQEAARAIEFERAAYKKAQYAMVALADDIFLRQTDWAGSAVFRERPLELELFPDRKAPRAAEEFYERARDLIDSPDPANAAVCEVYFWAMALGFEGIHKRSSDMHGMTKRQLLDRFSKGLEQPKRLTPAAYTNVATQIENPLLPSAWIASAILGTAVIVFLVILVVGARVTTQGMNSAIGDLNAANSELEKLSPTPSEEDTVEEENGAVEPAAAPGTKDTKTGSPKGALKKGKKAAAKAKALKSKLKLPKF